MCCSGVHRTPLTLTMDTFAPQLRPSSRGRWKRNSATGKCHPTFQRYLNKSCICNLIKCLRMAGCRPQSDVGAGTQLLHSRQQRMGLRRWRHQWQHCSDRSGGSSSSCSTESRPAAGVTAAGPRGPRHGGGPTRDRAARCWGGGIKGGPQPHVTLCTLCDTAAALAPGTAPAQLCSFTLRQVTGT